MLANLSAILGAAVKDGLISRNPCASRSVRAPAVEQDRVVPWTLDQVAAVVAAHPAPARPSARHRRERQHQTGAGPVFGVDHE